MVETAGIGVSQSHAVVTKPFYGAHSYKFKSAQTGVNNLSI